MVCVETDHPTSGSINQMALLKVLKPELQLSLAPKLRTCLDEHYLCTGLGELSKCNSSRSPE